LNSSTKPNRPWLALLTVASILFALQPAFGQSSNRMTTKPAETWQDFGQLSGYKSSAELLAKSNSIHQALFDSCMSRMSGSPTYDCQKLVMTGIRPSDPNGRKTNGDYLLFTVNAYWYYQNQNGSYTRDASDNYGVIRNLHCAASIGFSPVTTRLSSSEDRVDCVKFVPPPQQCIPGAKGKSSGSGAPGGVGNPITLVGGTKTEKNVDYASADGLLELTRFFQGQAKGWRFPGDPELIDATAGVTLTYRFVEKFIGSTTDPVTGRAIPHEEYLEFAVIAANAFGEVWRLNPDGSETGYPMSANGTLAIGLAGDEVTRLNAPTGDGSTWRWRGANDVTKEYGSDGRLRRVFWPDGKFVVYGYSSDKLTSVSDLWGRQVTASVDDKGRLASFGLPDGSTISYEYGPNQLTRVTAPDGTTTQYVYTEGASVKLIAQMTGKIDEKGVQTGTYQYDSSGRAISTESANGVNKYIVSDYGSYSQVTPPVGSPYVVYYGTVGGGSAVSSRTQPAGSGCSASSSSLNYDAAGNVASRNDFNGQRVCYAYDLTRNIESARVEGLASGTTCSTVTGTGATLPMGARKTSTQWHPDWRMATKIAEPGRITTLVFNGQPDPFAGGAMASCAPASALLPEGKPIAVLCRQIEQATTDVNGSQGFSATLQAGVPNREQKWTYNQYGQVLTHDGPRTDVNDVTTYAYYSDTSFTGSGAAAVGHTQGDLQSVTNAAGQVTQYTKYNKHGQVLERVGPNGVVTTRTYDLRQRLLSTTEAGQTTTYTYDAAGQLTRVTWPDASYVGYEYDPAHRQTAVYDQLGNRIEYTLDNAGNRIAENVKDPGGVLSRQLSRSIDALGRVQQTTGRE
jgi:YD repeat-containing protein